MVGRATWSEFRRNQEQAHFWTPNELPRIIETMKGLNLCASEKSDADNDLEKSPWGHKCALILLQGIILLKVLVRGMHTR